MGEYLVSCGHTVLGVRLAGHATSQEDLLRIRWQDWMASVEDGWHLLEGTTENIFLVGLSMGGALCLLSAARLPASGVISMSTPYDLPDDPRLPWIHFLHLLQPSIPKGPPDWRDPIAAEGHINYPSYPTKAIIQVRDLLAQMRSALPKLDLPVLLVHSRNDQTVDPSSMPAIYRALGSLNKSMLWVEDSNHVVTREPEKLKVFKAATDFIEQVMQIHNEP